ncbi:HD domain-containing protein [bacterium]|nr:HD domain-containing protein [candidate division CSSED10-310 bacterium]
MLNTLCSEAVDLSRDLLEVLRKTGFHACLKQLKDRLEETYDHSFRVCALSLDLGLENKLGSRDLTHLGLAGLVHDFGKINIPPHILSKCEELNSREYRIVQGHVRLGYLQVGHLENGTVGDIVAMHHEFKCNPYPRTGHDRRRVQRSIDDRRQPKPEIRRLGQILAIADMVDAMVHHRSYRKAMTVGETERILRREFKGDGRLIDQVLARVRNLQPGLADRPVD